MKDENKTKAQLIDELAELRQRIAGLEQAESQRATAQEALHETEERYRSVLHDSLDGIAIVEGPDVRFVNRALLEMFGYESEDEMVGRTFTDFVSPECRDLMTARGVSREQGEHVPSRYEFKALRKDGTQFDAELSVSAVPYEGRVARQGIVRDASQLGEAEEQLRYHAELLQDVSDAIISTDMDFKIKSWNRAAETMYGWKADEVAGKPVHEVTRLEYPHDTMEEVVERFFEEAYWRGEVIQKRKDGQAINVLASVSLMRDSAGNPVGAVGVNCDITDRKRVEEALKRAKREWEHTFDAMSDWVSLVDPDTRRILRTNRQGEEIVGVPLKQIIGQSCCKLLHGSDEPLPECPLQEMLHTQQRASVELPIVGDDRWAMITVDPVADDDGNIVGGVQIVRDITERKRREQALTESEEQFRSLAERSPNMIFINKKSRVVYANQMCEDLMGYTREEFYSPDFDFLTMVAPESVDIVTESYARHMEGEEVPPYEYTLIDKQGERIGAINATRCISYEGELAILGVVTDITERKRAEEEIRKLNQFLRSIIENANVWLDVLDEKANVVLWNKAAEEISGYSHQEVVGHGLIWEWLYPDEEYRKEVVAGAMAIIERGDVEEDAETAIRRKDGQTRIISWNSRGLVDEAGNPVGSIALGRDITERRRVEEALRESEEKYRSLVERANDGIGIFQDGVCKYANPRLAQIARYPVEELIGSRFLELIHPSDIPRLTDRYKRRLAGEEVPPVYETVIKLKDGSDLNVEVNASVITYQGKPADFAILRDITERRRAEQALRDSEQEKAAILASLSELLVHQDTEFRVIWANRAAAESVGLSVGELAGRHCYEVWQQRNKPCIDCPVAAALQSGEPQEAETSTPDGRAWFVRGYPVRGEDGHVVGAVEVALETTERKQAEEALRQSEERYRELANSITDVFFAMDEGLRYTFWNKASEDLTGIPAKDAIGKSLLEIFPDTEEARRTVAAYREVLKTQEPQTFGREYRLDGRDYFFEISVYPSGTGLSVFAKDVTGRKRMEGALRESEERYRALFEQAADSIVLVDAETGALVEFNDRAHEKLGYTRKELEGLSIADFEVIESADEVAKHIERVVTEGVDTFETKHRTKDGEARDVQVRVRAISIGGRDLVQGIWRDITERKRAEDQVRARTKELEALNAVAETVSQSLNLEEILNSALDKVLEIMSAEAGGIYVADEARRRLTLKVHRGVSEEFVAQVGTVDLDAETVDGAGELSRVGKLILATELLLKDRGLLKKVTTAIAREKLRSHLQVMIRVKEAPYGLLVVASRESREFTAREEEFLSTVATQIGMAIENAGLYDDQMERVFEMDALRRTTLDITRQLDLDALLESIASRAVQLLRGSAGGLYLYRPEWDVLEWAVAIGDGLGPIGTTLARGEGLSGRVWETREPLVVDDYQHWHGVAPVYDGYAWTAVVGVPVHWGEKFLGVLDVLADRPGAFSQADADLLSLFASQAAIAIENARLYEETRRRAEELALLNRVTTATTSTLDLQEVLQAVAEEMAAAFGIDQCAIALLDESGQQLTVTAEYLAPGRPSALGDVIPAEGNPSVRQVLKTGIPVGIKDAQKDPLLAPVHDLMQKRGTKSLLIVPLVVKGEVIGTIGVDFVASRHEFTAEEIALAQSVAGQAAVAVENARLYEQQERRLVEMTALYETSLEMIGQLDLRKLLASIVARATGLLGAAGGALFLYSSEDGEVEAVADHNSPVDLTGITLKPGEGVAGKVVQTGEALIVENYVQWEGRSKQFDSIPFSGVIGVPLKWGPQVTGVIVVNEMGKPRCFDEHDLRLLTLLANQAALAIGNARLYEEAETRRAYLETLQEITATLRSTLPAQEVLEMIVRKTSEALGYVGAVVVLPDPAGERLVLGAVSGGSFIDSALRFTGSAIDQFSVPLKVEKNPMAEAFLSGELVTLISDPEGIVAGVEPKIGPRVARAIERAIGAKSAACVPLRIAEKSVGVLIVMSAREQLASEERAMLLGLADQAALAIENASLYAETERRAEELAALHDVSLDVLGELGLPALLQTITEQAIDLLGEFAGGLYLYDAESQELELVAAKGLWEDRIGTRLAPGEGVSGKVAQSGEPLVVMDYATWEGRSPQFDGVPSFNTLAVPIKRGDALLGALYVNDPHLEREFDEGDIRLATLFANQAAVAIENARLYEQTERRAEELATLYDVSLEVVAEIELAETLQTVVDEAVQLLEADTGAIDLFDPQAEELELITAHGYDQGYSGIRMALGEGLAGKVAQGKEPLVVEDYLHWEGRSPQWEQQETGAALGVPLAIGDQLLGVLTVNRRVLRPFDENDLRLATLFANQAAIAIENAQLYEAQERRAEELMALHQIGLLLSQSLDPSEVLVAIADSALELFQASDVHAFLYDSESEELTFAAASWATSEARDAFRHPRKEGLTATVARTGEPLLIAETKSHPLFAAYDDWRRDMESIGGFPLKRGDRVVGVLNIAFSSPHTFETDELRLATLFANQAAIAIENARLMDEVRTHGTELRRLSGQLINAQEEERRRISQELHDELGQALTAMSINLATMAKELPSELAPVATERLAETSSLVDSTLDQMRELALDLRPSMLDDLGLLPTLRWYVNRYGSRTNIEVEFGAIDLDERLPSDMETVLYRVVQEALTNVARHAEANRVRVRLERKESGVSALIEDDGKGFDVKRAGDRDAPGRGAGLVGMRERVASVRGSFNVESRRGRGTRLSIEIPLL